MKDMKESIFSQEIFHLIFSPCTSRVCFSLHNSINVTGILSCQWSKQCMKQDLGKKREHKGTFCSSLIPAVSRLIWDLPAYLFLREMLLSRNQRHTAISVRAKGLHILYSRGIASKAQRISSCVLSRITESLSLTKLIWFSSLIFMCTLALKSSQSPVFTKCENEKVVKVVPLSLNLNEFLPVFPWQGTNTCELQPMHC